MTLLERKKRRRMREALEEVAPGTELRDAIDRILEVGSGALIVAGEPSELKQISSGGFTIDCEFSAPRLFELAKMDGAVILDRELKRIERANVHLVPDSSIPTDEAGMRHRTAERVARQKDSLVLSISEKMNTVTVYLGDDHFVLESIPLALAKADQALQTLSRYRARMDNEFSSLDTLELDDMVTLRDVVNVLESTELVARIADEITFQLCELGKDGRLVRLQLRELMEGVDEQQMLLLRDYLMPGAGDPEALLQDLRDFSPEEITSETGLARILGYAGAAESLNKLVRPRGYRVLSMIPVVPGSVIENVVERFDNLKNIMRASTALLNEVDGVGERRAMAIKERLERLAEQA